MEISANQNLTDALKRTTTMNMKVNITALSLLVISSLACNMATLSPLAAATV